MALKVAIVDYGTGNIQSVYRALTRLQINPAIAASPQEVLNADKIILPGVGHFETAINNLKKSGLFEALNEAALVKQTPILGICLGMQLMAKHSDEGNSQGLGWMNANVIKFGIKDKLKFKVPHTGWNTIQVYKESRLLKNIKNQSEFYFLHAYHYDSAENTDILTKTNFEYDFVSGVEKGNIFGTQFHPEKSHGAGLTLLDNFIQL